jgi:hypothetical protein
LLKNIPAAFGNSAKLSKVAIEECNALDAVPQMFSRYLTLALVFDRPIRKAAANANAAVKIDFSRLDEWTPPPLGKESNGWMTKLRVTCNPAKCTPTFLAHLTAVTSLELPRYHTEDVDGNLMAALKGLTAVQNIEVGWIG